MVELAREACHWALGPGFESQVPPKPLYYFVTGNPMQNFRRGPSCSSSHQTPSGPPVKSNGLGWTSTIHSGQQAPMESQKSKQAGVIGPGNLPDSPPFWAQHPLGYFFFIFHSFYYLIVFIIIIKKLTN